MAFSNILVPMDFSRCAKNALQFTMQLADSFQSKLVLVHVAKVPYTNFDPMVVDVPAQNILATITAQIASQFEQLILSEELEPSNTTTKIMFGGFLESIQECVAENKIDLIVTGTHESHGWLDQLFGSNSASIVAHANIPVLIIPENHRPHRIQLIGIAIDIENELDLDKLVFVKELAAIMSAKLVIINVMNDSSKRFVYDDQKVKLSQYLKDISHTYHTVSIEGPIDELLLGVAKSLKLDVLYMNPKNYGIFEGLFHSSSTKSIAMTIDIPLMTVHE